MNTPDTTEQVKRESITPATVRFMKAAIMRAMSFTVDDDTLMDAVVMPPIDAETPHVLSRR